MLVTFTDGVVSPDESCVTELISRVMLLAVDPSFQLTPIAAGLGLVEAIDPSLLKLSVIGLPLVMLPTAVLVSDDEVGSARLAVQVLVAVLVQVTWIEAGLPSES